MRVLIPFRSVSFSPKALSHKPQEALDHVDTTGQQHNAFLGTTLASTVSQQSTGDLLHWRETRIGSMTRQRADVKDATKNRDMDERATYYWRMAIQNGQRPATGNQHQGDKRIQSLSLGEGVTSRRQLHVIFRRLRSDDDARGRRRQ